MKKISNYTVIFLVFLLSSCGTFKRSEVDHIYPATTIDGFIIYTGSSNFLQAHEPVPWYQQLFIRPALIIVGIIDLPISIVTDTILLPYDIYTTKQQTEAAEASSEKKEGSNESD